MSVISNDSIKLNISKALLNKILEFGELNKFQPFKVATVKTSSLEQALEGDKINYNFITQYKGMNGIILIIQTLN